jgi:hypothetical protein
VRLGTHLGDGERQDERADDQRAGISRQIRSLRLLPSVSAAAAHATTPAKAGRRLMREAVRDIGFTKPPPYRQSASTRPCATPLQKEQEADFGNAGGGSRRAGEPENAALSTMPKKTVLICGDRRFSHDVPGAGLTAYRMVRGSALA